VIIGVTGGVASGKSTVAAILASKGATVIDADAIAREVVAPGRPVLDKIRQRFGDDVIGPDGTLDRLALAGLVFSDARALGDLNAIIHPEILEEIARRIAESDPSEMVVLDAALLVEAAAEVERAVRMDALIVVASTPEAQIARMESARGMDRHEAQARIAAQASLEDKLGAADYVIDNRGSLAELPAKVEAVWNQITRRA
jgi:dephospho-CoA kinase